MSQRYDVMMVEEYVDPQGQGRSKWTKIGAAFTNKDGSIGVQLVAMPINGKVILQVPLSEEEREAKFGATGKAFKQQAQGQQRAPRGGGPQRGNYGGYGGRQAPAQAPDYPPEWEDTPVDPQGGGGFADE